MDHGTVKAEELQEDATNALMGGVEDVKPKSDNLSGAISSGAAPYYLVLKLFCGNFAAEVLFLATPPRTH